MNERGMRKRLPDRRAGGFTQRVKIGQQTVFLRTGEYEDGTLGEIFIDTHRQGAFTSGILQNLAMVCSIALQYGTPFEAVVSILRGSRYPPEGFVVAEEGTSSVEKCSSLADYVAQELEANYDENGRRRPKPLPHPRVARRAEQQAAEAEAEVADGGEEKRPLVTVRGSVPGAFDGTYPVAEKRLDLRKESTGQQTP